MPVLLAYGLLAVTPALAMLGAGKLLERWARADGPQRGRRGAPAPSGPGLERLVADLRRLEADYRRIADSDMLGRVARMRTVTLAYDDVLRACCRAVGLDEPDTPLSTLERLHTEAALAQQGVTW